MRPIRGIKVLSRPRMRPIIAVRSKKIPNTISSQFI
jgi:hypothetical protein